MKRFALLLLALLLPFACIGDRQAPAEVNHDEVLDTSSPDEPRMLEPGDFASAAAAQNLFLRATDSNQVIRNLSLHGTSYTGPIVVSSGKETLTKIEYKRWSVVNDISAGQNAKWGMLVYNEVDCTYTSMVFAGIKAEHAIYQHSPRGMVLLQDLFVFDIGAQGFQQTWRGLETSDPLGYLHTGTHRLQRCAFIKCGQPRGYGRASYALSFFGRQEGDGSSPRKQWDCPVELIDVVIEHDPQGAYELRGALLVEWRPSVLIQNCRINYVGASDRDLVHLFQNVTVRVENSYIHGSRTFDIDGGRVQSVVFTSPGFDGGDTRVRINGVTVGTTDDEIVWNR